MRSSHSSDEDRRLQGRRRSGAPSPGLRRSPALPAPLHLQSRHSLLRGVVPIEELAARAGRYGYGAFCVADRNNLYGSVCAWRAARAAGLKAIIGAELDDGAPEGAARRGEPRREEPRTALLLARDRAGYARLCRAVTRRKLAEREGGRGEAPGFDLVETIAADPTGLFILTENPELAGGLAARLGRRAREALFVELSRPVASVARERRLLHAAQSLGLSVVAGGATPFLDAPDASFHHLLEAMRTLSTVRRVAAGAPAPPANRLLPPRALADLYRDLPQALETSARIARECRVDFDPDRHVFPRFEIPAGETSYSLLYQRCHEGLRRRYRIVPPDAVERLAHELKVIREMGFLEYFLIVGDIVACARARGIECAGRGSGAGSIVAYTLGITQVDPLRHRLYFERFLHRGRRDLPDIDIDLCWIGRDQVIEHVYERYGHDRVAMISTHVTFQPRSAFREVARAHGMPPDLVDRISSRIPHRTERPLPELLREEPILERVSFPAERLRAILEAAEGIRGFPHHLSIHPGGIVIADRPIEHYVALERAAKGILVTQLDMYSIEDVGLVKIDLLGNRCLSEVRESLDLVEREGGARPDLDALAEGDRKTARLLSSGRTLGCFQLESPAMRSLLRRIGARDVRGVINAVALIRPGPAEGGMKERFIARARGEEPATPLHPLLEPLLRRRHGILLYEEDVMCAASIVAGLTMPEGDLLRRAVKTAAHLGDEAGLERLADRFIARAIGNGVAASEARTIWEALARFGRYAFNKAHAASYGLLAYRSAWLKAHHPRAFLCAVFNHHAGMYPFQAFVAEARRMGVRLLLPCVNRSAERFTLEEEGIRIPLGRVKGLSRRAIDSIIAGRPFRSLAEVIARARLSLVELEDLILAGALDGIGRARTELLWEARTTHARERRRRDAPPLAGLGGAAPELGELPLPRRVAEEIRLLGAGITAHPMHFFRERRERDGCTPLSEVEQRVGRIVRVAGIRIASRRVRTKRGDAMGFLTLEDEGGLLEVILFPAAWKRALATLQREGPFLVEGRVEEQQGAVSLNARRVEAWGRAEE